MKTLAALAVALVAWAAAAGAASASPRARIDAFLDSHWPRGAGGSVLVAEGGRALVCEGRGWADRARQVRADCDTGYDVMSMTKQFTAAAILKLEMQGRLRTGDSIERWFGAVPADKRAITIADLLDQTSGLVGIVGGDYEPLSRRQLVARAMRAPLLSPPGSEYHYSNVGFSLLAAIVEKAAGMDYERYLRRYLFLPAGMRHTGYLLPHWRPRQVAVEYDRHGRPRGHPFDHRWAGDGPYWNLRGNGGIVSTARDMLRWQRALLAARILDRRAMRELFAPRFEYERGTSSAFGWDVISTRFGPVATHNGGNLWSFGAITRLLRQKVMVFWVTNQVRRAGGWNFEPREGAITAGLARAALGR